MQHLDLAPSRHRPRRRERDDLATGSSRSPANTSGEPEMVRKFRGEFASYVSTVSFLMLLNVVAPGLEFPWFLFPTGFDRYTQLWTSGDSWRDVINRPPAPDAVEARTGTDGGSALRTPKTPAGALKAGTADPDEFGRYADQLKQVERDRAGIHQIVAKLPDSERAMLPEVGATVDSLSGKAQELARTLAGD